MLVRPIGSDFQNSKKQNFGMRVEFKDPQSIERLYENIEFVKKVAKVNESPSLQKFFGGINDFLTAAWESIVRHNNNPESHLVYGQDMSSQIRDVKLVSNGKDVARSESWFNPEKNDINPEYIKAITADSNDIGLVFETDSGMSFHVPNCLYYKEGTLKVDGFPDEIQRLEIERLNELSPRAIRNYLIRKLSPSPDSKPVM